MQVEKHQIRECVCECVCVHTQPDPEGNSDGDGHIPAVVCTPEWSWDKQAQWRQPRCWGRNQRSGNRRTGWSRQHVAKYERKDDVVAFSYHKMLFFPNSDKSFLPLKGRGGQERYARSWGQLVNHTKELNQQASVNTSGFPQHWFSTE